MKLEAKFHEIDRLNANFGVLTRGAKGDKGDDGPQGPQGISGVYLGSGEMPDGYNVQIDPDGEPIEVYTKQEADNTFATKEEVVGTLGTINEVLATLVEVE